MHILLQRCRVPKAPLQQSPCLQNASSLARKRARPAAARPKARWAKARSCRTRAFLPEQTGSSPCHRGGLRSLARDPPLAALFAPPKPDRHNYLGGAYHRPGGAHHRLDGANHQNRLGGAHHSPGGAHHRLPGANHRSGWPRHPHSHSAPGADSLHLEVLRNGPSNKRSAASTSSC